MSDVSEPSLPLVGAPERASSYWRKRDYRSGPPTLDEVRTRVPCQSVLIEGCAPMVIAVQPGDAVRLEGADVARHAGLDLAANASSWARPGELCGAVLMANVQGSAMVTRGGWDYSRLKAHQLTALAFTTAAEVDLRAVSRQGTLWVWPCAAASQ